MPTVTLGQHDYEVVAQPYARIFRGISKIIGDAGGLDPTTLESPEMLAVGLEDQAHGFLKLLVPNLMPAWEFEGYTSAAAKAAGEYDDEAVNRTPTLPQIIGAFEAAFEVNGGRRFADSVGKLIGPALLQEARKMLALGLSKNLRSTLARSGESGSTPPSAKRPTSDANGSEDLVSTGELKSGSPPAPAPAG